MLYTAPFTLASATETQIIASPDAKRKIKVVGLWLSFSGTVNAKFTSGPAGGATVDVTKLFYGILGTAIVLPQPTMIVSGISGWFEAATGADLNLKLSAGVAVDGMLVWVTSQ